MSSVLLVEDDEKIQRMYQFAFEASGFEVVTAPNGSEALLRISDRMANSSKSFDAIVLDMMMLGMSGLDFLKSYNRDQSPSTKILVLTNIDNPNVETKARELGVNEYLNKANYDPGQIVERIKALIGSK